MQNLQLTLDLYLRLFKTRRLIQKHLSILLLAKEDKRKAEQHTNLVE